MAYNGVGLEVGAQRLLYSAISVFTTCNPKDDSPPGPSVHGIL